MAGSRQAPDRSRQRERTQKALVDTAAELLRAGREPGVAEVAEAAGVHRATAYRYFPTPDLLLSEAALTARAPTPEELVARIPADDPFALLDAVVRGVTAFSLSEETLVRAALRHTVARSGARGTRRFDYLAPVMDAIADRVDEDGRRRLAAGLALAFGAEALVVARDVCEMEPAEAVETLAWTAATLLRGALTTDP